MEKKRWYMSKTVWSNILVVVITLLGAVDTQFETGIMSMPVTQTIITVLGLFGIYGRVVAKTE
ncbi:MAG: hypothetical protein DRP78_06905, partial [Candidatus Omnitrophota bacterium]